MVPGLGGGPVGCVCCTTPQCKWKCKGEVEPPPPKGVGPMGLWVLGAVRPLGGLKVQIQRCAEALRLQPCVGAQALIAFPVGCAPVPVCVLQPAQPMHGR